MPFRVFLDPGHGGKDSGAKGISKACEKEVALSLALKIKESLDALQKDGRKSFDVALSREKDQYVSLKQRVSRANAWNADVYVSLHANSSPAAPQNGFEIYFMSPEASDPMAEQLAFLENSSLGIQLPKNRVVTGILADLEMTLHIQQSSQLAERVFSSLASEHKPSGRGVRQGPFAVLSGTKMPSILIEAGYLTNVDEASRLDSDAYLKKLAEKIASGIVEFLKKNSRRGSS